MKSVAREVAIQPLGGLVPCNFNLNIDVIFWYLISSLFFDEKLYQILSHFGEKSKFWTFSEKLDLSPSTDPTHWSCIQSEINCWNIISKQLTRHNSAAFISKIHFVKTHPISLFALLQKEVSPPLWNSWSEASCCLAGAS